MKKIECFMGTLAGGGAEHQMSILSSLLAERGYDVTVTTFQYDVEDQYEINKKIKRVRLAEGRGPIARLIALMKAAFFTKAEVVITWGQLQNVFILFPLLFRKRVKVICGERNYTKPTPNVFEKILYLGLYKRAFAIVPNSFTQRDYQCEKHPSYSDKIVTISNYTDKNEYNFSLPPQNKVRKIGIFCRVEEQKNFVRFVDAIRKIVELDKYEFHVDWYGNHTFKNPKQIKYYEEGSAIIKSSHIERYITIHDRTKDVPFLIPTYDAMCLPSIYEGFSNSIAEYICCGKPVICSNVSDNHIMVNDGINGFLFDPLNVDDIANAIRKFLELPDESVRKMGETSREIAETLFDKNRFVQQYINLIEDNKVIK